MYKPKEEVMFDAIYAATLEAIKRYGLDNFKKTSMFASNEIRIRQNIKNAA